MTVLDELKQAIMATEGKFSADDFYHITTARGAHQSAVSKAFRLLRDDFCIKIVGHRGSEGCKRDLICYEVVKGAKIVVKERKEMKPRKIVEKIEAKKVEPKGTADVYYQRVNLKESAMNECGKRMESAMSGWR